MGDDARRERLAAALRANLRLRKAGAAPVPADPPAPVVTGEADRDPADRRR